MSSDGSDGAGGVGGSGGTGGASGASGAGSSDASSAADSLGNAAQSVGDAIGQAAESVADAVSDALGSITDAAGLSDALGQLGDMLGIDAQDLQGIVGSALMGAITGGLPGAVAAVASSLLGGSLTDAARDAVSANVPAQYQGIVNAAVDTFARGIPGAMSASNLQGTLGTLANGVLSNGRTPSIGDLGDVARSLTDLGNVARGVMDGVTRGDFASAADAASRVDGALRSGFEQGRQVANGVAEGFARGGDVYADGGRGAYLDAVERMAVSTGRLIAN